jgi:hypothetical protein
MWPCAGGLPWQELQAAALNVAVTVRAAWTLVTLQTGDGAT